MTRAYRIPPYRCPFCGATNRMLSDSPSAVPYECGAVLDCADSRIVEPCPQRYSWATVAYQGMEWWRRKLSQHTGLSLDRIGRPRRVNGGVASWGDLTLDMRPGTERKRRLTRWGRRLSYDGGDAVRVEARRALIGGRA